MSNKVTPRILNVSQNFYVQGGSDSYFFALTDLLEKNGHEVIPFASKNSKNRITKWDKYFPSAANFEAPKPADAIKFIYSTEARTALARLLDDHPVSVAHLHIYYGKLTSSILGEFHRRGVPVVQTLHEYKLICPVYTCLRDGRPCEDCHGKSFWRASTNRCNRGSFARSLLSTAESYVSKAAGNLSKIDHFVAVSEFIKGRMVANGVDPAKISVVRNFVDCSRFIPSESRGQYFLYFGRVEAIKGIETLLKAFSKNGLPLVIAGNGNYMVEAQALASELSSNENIRFVGFKSGSDLHDLIRDSVATILPAEWYENCPMSVLESFALGRAVLGTNIGGIPELISHGVDGFVFEPRDPDALAEHASYMWNNRATAVDMGKSAREKVQTNFNADSHYRQLSRVYASFTGATSTSQHLIG